MQRMLWLLVAVVLVGAVAFTVTETQRAPVAVAQDRMPLRLPTLTREMAAIIYPVQDTTWGALCYVQAYTGAMSCFFHPGVPRTH